MFWLNLIVHSNETQYIRASNPSKSFSFCNKIKLFCRITANSNNIKKNKVKYHKEATQAMCHMSVTWYIDVRKIASCLGIINVQKKE